ncbi:MAG: hypothetical protein WDO19_21815 [Bacteroidota bacterium]
MNQPFDAGVLVPFKQIIASGTSPATLTANPGSGGSCVAVTPINGNNLLMA